jgi:hypothetical protein
LREGYPQVAVAAVANLASSPQTGVMAGIRTFWTRRALTLTGALLLLVAGCSGVSTGGSAASGASDSSNVPTPQGISSANSTVSPSVSPSPTSASFHPLESAITDADFGVRGSATDGPCSWWTAETLSRFLDGAQPRTTVGSLSTYFGNGAYPATRSCWVRIAPNTKVVIERLIFASPAKFEKFRQSLGPAFVEMAGVGDLVRAYAGPERGTTHHTELIEATSRKHAIRITLETETPIKGSGSGRVPRLAVLKAAHADVVAALDAPPTTPLVLPPSSETSDASDPISGMTGSAPSGSCQWLPASTVANALGLPASSSPSGRLSESDDPSLRTGSSASAALPSNIATSPSQPSRFPERVTSPRCADAIRDPRGSPRSRTSGTRHSSATRSRRISCGIRSWSFHGRRVVTVAIGLYDLKHRGAGAISDRRATLVAAYRVLPTPS